MKYKNYFLLLNFCLLSLYDNSWPAAAAFPHPEQTAEAIFRVNLFLDKTMLQKGDSLSIVLQVENLSPDSLQILDMQVMNSEFSIIRSPEHRKPVAPHSNEFYHFQLKGGKAGRFNLLARITVQKLNLAAGQQPATIIKQFENSEVVLSSSETSKRLFDFLPFLVGAGLGLLVSILTSLFNETRSAKKEKRENANWLADSLLPQLQTALEAVKHEERVEYDRWVEKLFTGGMYSMLIALSEKIKKEPHLGIELVSLSLLLREYNESHQARRIGAEMKESLIKKLSTSIDSLTAARKLKGIR
jgi:hypothetical protein